MTQEKHPATEVTGRTMMMLPDTQAAPSTPVESAQDHRATDPAPPKGKEQIPFIPAWLDDSQLTPPQFRVLAHVARRVKCWESLTNIARVCGVKRRTAQLALKDLTRMNVLVAEQRHGQTVIYSLSPCPRSALSKAEPRPFGVLGSKHEPRPKGVLGSKHEPRPKGVLGSNDTQAVWGTRTQAERGTNHLGPLGYYKGNPTKETNKGEDTPPSSQSKFQNTPTALLLKDRRLAKDEIRQIDDSVAPDKDMRRICKATLSEIESELKRRGKELQPAPAPAPIAPAPTAPTPAPIPEPEHGQGEVVDPKLAEQAKAFGEAARKALAETPAYQPPPRRNRRTAPTP